MTPPPMACPSCGRALRAMRARHGLVWLCHTCRSGAATLPILRQVAPRDFVNQLWQAALHEGRASSANCPACRQPFTTFRGSSAYVEPQLEVCTRCYWVWLGPTSLSSLSRLKEPTAIRGLKQIGQIGHIEEVDVVPEKKLSPRLARESLHWLAGQAIRRVLD